MRAQLFLYIYITFFFTQDACIRYYIILVFWEIKELITTTEGTGKLICK